MKWISYGLYLFFLVLGYYGFPQVSDNFDDGDFISNPVWISSNESGNGVDFTISNGELRSAGPPSSTSLSIFTSGIQNLSTNDLTWEFKARYGSGAPDPSGSNNIRIFLVSDSQDLSSISSGYYLQLGESGSGDGIDLFREGNSIPLIEDPSNLVASGININIRVTRTSLGSWTLSADVTGGETFIEIGTYEELDPPAFGEYFGFVVNHTSTNNENFYFDDVAVTSNPVADTQAPTLMSFEVLSSDRILLNFSEEVDAVTSQFSGSYEIEPAISILQAERQIQNTNLVIVAFSSSFSSGTGYEMSLTGISDAAGNTLSDTTVSFFYVEFSEPSFREIVINEVLPDPGSNALPDTEYIELFNTSGTRFFKTELLKIRDASGSTVTLPTDTLRPNEYLLLVSDTTLYPSSINTLPVNLPSLNNNGDVIYLLNEQDVFLDSLVYTVSGQNSIEQVNPDISFFLEENYVQSIAATGGTPGLINSAFDDTPDTTSPGLIEVLIRGEDTLILRFDERLDPTVALQKSNYEILETSQNPSKVSLAESDRTVLLSFDRSFPSGDLQNLSITGVTDLFGNTVITTQSFVYYFLADPELGDVLVNEFLVAPNDAEFIELINVSEQYFDLQDWQLVDQSGNVITLPSHILFPDSLVVLTSVTGMDSLGVTGFPLLNNSRDMIQLRDRSEELIYEVAYEDFLEGFSYELINREETCKGIFNYAINESGNTAGKVNQSTSTVADIEGPMLTYFEVLSKDSIKISFNEPVTQQVDPFNFFELESNTVTAIEQQTSTQWILILGDELKDEVFTSLTVKDIEDCLGNVSEDTTLSLFIDEKPPMIEDLTVLSNDEILIRLDEALEPISSSDEGKFMISELFVERLKLPDTIANSVIIQLDSQLELDQDYHLIVDGLEDTLGNQLQDTISFTYSSDIQSFQIISSNEIEIIFDSNIDSSLSINQFSLDGIGQPAEMHIQDSSAVVLAFDQLFDSGEAQRLYLFKAFSETGTLLKTPTLDFVYQKLFVEKVTVADSRMIEVTFSNHVDPSSVIDAANLSLGDSLEVEEAMTRLDKPFMVYLKLSDSLRVGSSYKLLISSIRDVNFNLLSDTTVSFFYVEFSEPSFREIVINEFLPDPGSNALPDAEYIELFNTSGTRFFKTELLKIRDASGSTVALPADTLRPNEYLLLVSDTTLYPSSINTLPVNLPSLNNNGDVIYLLVDEQDSFLDSLVYTVSGQNSIEQVNPDISFFLEENYVQSIAATGGTPGLINSAFDDTPDTTSPGLIEVLIRGEDTLLLRFDERLDPTVALQKSNYEILETSQNPSKVSLAESDRTVLLSFDQSFPSGDLQNLSITGVTDLFGNTVITTQSFVYYFLADPELGDVLVNEFLVAPNDAEFIELINVSDQYFDLQDWQLVDQSGNVITLPSHILFPDSLVVLTSVTGMDSLGVTGFPLLNNSRDMIQLRDRSEELIYEVAYEDFLEGFSYELINREETCKGIFNYAINESGNTAGKVNSATSIVADIEGPMLTYFEVLSKDSIKISFNEPVTQQVDPFNFFELESNTVTAIEQQTSTQWILILGDELKDEVFTSLTVKDIEDCLGNVSEDTTLSLFIDKKAPMIEDLTVLSNDEILIRLDEALEPISSSDEGKFMISELFVERLKLPDTITNSVIIQLESQLELDQDYHLIVDGLEDTLGNQLQDTISFTYSSDIQSFRVLSNSALELEFAADLDRNLSYNQFDLIDMADVGQIQFQDSSTVRVIFEDAFKENEDQRLYMFQLSSSKSEILQTPAIDFIFDTNPPQLADAQIPSSDSLFLVFDEPLNISSAVNPLNYTLDGQIPLAVVPLDPRSLVIFPLEAFEREEVIRLTYNGLSDLNGNIQTEQKSEAVIFDVFPPQIDSIYQSGLHSIHVIPSEKLDTGSVHCIEAWIQNDELSHSLEISFINENAIELIYADSIPQVNVLDVFLTGWKDQRLNQLEDTIRASLDTSRPILSLIQPISPNQLLLYFSHTLNQTAIDSDNYYLSGVNVISVQKMGISYLLNLENELEDNQFYQVQVANVTNNDGLSVVPLPYEFQFLDYLEEVIILDSTRVTLKFAEEISSPSAGIKIEDLELDYQEIRADQKNEVNVLLKQSIPPNDTLFISWDTLRIDRSRIIPAGVSSLVYDTKPPIIIDVTSDYLGQITIEFSESVWEVSASNLSNYSINGISPVSLGVISGRRVQLVFDFIQLGSTYDLIYNSIVDLSNNVIEAGRFTFTYHPPMLPSRGDIVINEIMFDPSPSVGLVEEEYIELWNISDNDYNLRGLVFSDQASEVLLPDYLLESGQYVALGGSDNQLMVSGFPSLNNEGELISIKTIEGEILDSVAFDRDWIEPSEKRGGGYSLELINPKSVCSGPGNWSASLAEAGGTPGFENSVYNEGPDATSPKIKKSELILPDLVSLTFNELMDSSFVPNQANLLVDSIYYLSKTRLEIKLENEIGLGSIETITISGFVDCSGNVLLDTALMLVRPKKPARGDLVITEIMADPSPVAGLPESEYLEIYNRCDHVIDLSYVEINGTELSGSLNASSYLLITPTSSIDAYEVENKQAVSPWVSLANTRDSLILSTVDEVLFDLVYDKSWYRNEDKADGGYSLEIIDPTLYCDGKSNWNASINPMGGTPGEKNSVDETRSDSKGPLIEEVLLSHETQLTMYFSEKVNAQLLEITSNPDLYIVENSSFYQWSTLVKLGLDSVPQLNLWYSINVTSAEDCYGNVADSLAYDFLQPQNTLDQLYINEVLFDPLTGGEDYIELYNGSDDQYVNLSALYWKQALGSRRIADDYVLAPNHYLVLTTDLQQLLFDFPSTPIQNALEVSWLPTMPNDEGELVVVDKQGRILDSIYYHEDFHSTLLSNVEGVSLERLSFDFDAVDKNNWISASSIEGFGTPGRINSKRIGENRQFVPVEVSPRVFVPGSVIPGRQTFTTISYVNIDTNTLANIRIYDATGRLIKTLGEGISLASEGYVIWDGTDDKGGLVRLGQYLVVFEYFGGGSGNQVYKKPITVATDF